MGLALARTQARMVGLTITSRWGPGNVVMFHAGRCGSTVLGQMLGETRRMLWLGELYDDLVATGTLPVFSEPRGHLRYLEAQMVKAGSRYFGFEVRFLHLRAMQLEMPSWLASLDELGFAHYVILQRRNALRALASTQIAAQGGPYHRSAGDSAELRTTTIELVRRSPQGEEIFLVDRLRRREEQYAHLERCLAGRNILRLTYEDDVERDPGVGYRRVCSFLASIPVRSRYDSSAPIRSR